MVLWMYVCVCVTVSFRASIDGVNIVSTRASRPDALRWPSESEVPRCPLFILVTGHAGGFLCSILRVVMENLVGSIVELDRGSVKREINRSDSRRRSFRLEDFLESRFHIEAKHAGNRRSVRDEKDVAVWREFNAGHEILIWVNDILDLPLFLQSFRVEDVQHSVLASDNEHGGVR